MRRTIALALLASCISANAGTTTAVARAVMVDTNGAIVSPTNAQIAVAAACAGGAYYGGFFSWAFSPQFSGLPDSTATVTNFDAYIERRVFDGKASDWAITWSNVRTGTNAVSIATDNAGIATANLERVYWVANGTATVTAAIAEFSRSTNMVMSSTYTGTNDYVTGAAAGSARHAAAGAIDAAIAAGGALELFSVQDHAATNYVRSTNCWARGFDLTCASPWNSTAPTNMIGAAGGVWGAGTLISPDIVVMARHWNMTNGSTIRFVTRSNAVVERTLVSKYAVGATDIMIGRLSAVIATNDIMPAHLLGAEAWHYLPTGTQFPVLFLDQEEKALCGEGGADFAASFYSVFRPAATNRAAYYESPVDRDSGNPVFLVRSNAAPVLLTCFHSAFGGPAAAFYRAQIVQGIAYLGGSTNIIEADLGAYTDFYPAPPAP